MTEEPKGNKPSLEASLKDYALCNFGTDHTFYIGQEKRKPGQPPKDITDLLRASSDSSIGLCPQHYARIGVNERHRDPATGKLMYQDYELAALELWQHIDKTVAEKELDELEMGDIRVLDYNFVVFKGDKKRVMPAQAVAFPGGKYGADQKKIILMHLLGEMQQLGKQQQQAEEPEALVKLENRARLSFELRNGPAFINGLLAAMNINDYRLNPEDKTEIVYSGKDFMAEGFNSEVARAVTERRKAAEAGIREIDRKIEAHMALQLDALIRREVKNQETARQLSEALMKYFGIGQIGQQTL